MTKQKLYRVRFKCIANYSNFYLNYDKSTEYWSIDSMDEGEIYKTSFTKEELEKAGLGWVFDSPLTEVWELL